MLIIEEDDVERTLGIPQGRNVVEEATRFEHLSEDADSAAYAKLVASWRERWGIDAKSPVTTSMPGQILERRDHGDMFKRDFVLYIVSAMLCGHQDRCCNFRILKSLINVDQIKTFNWCAYTHKSMVNSIQSFQKNDKQFFTGPVAFILVSSLYFDFSLLFL